MAKPHGLESMRLIFDTIIISRVCALKALSLPVQIGTKSEVFARFHYPQELSTISEYEQAALYSLMPKEYASHLFYCSLCSLCRPLFA